MFGCLECGKKFKTVAAAERAANQGCPKCGGSDIDIAVRSVAQKTAVTRDGAVIALVENTDAAFGFILRNQSQSVDWACKYEGWSWRPATEQDAVSK